MPQVVVKGESVYKCDVCRRKIRVPKNKHGLEVIQRCIITHNCQGRLHRTTDANEVNSTPAFPEEVQGTQDWFQRKAFYEHKQPVPSTTWMLHHNLGNNPSVHAFVNRIIDGVEQLVSVEPSLTTPIDANTTQITFDRAESGTAQCVSLTSQNATNPVGFSTVIAPTDALQITSDTGELTIATLASAPAISITLSYVVSSLASNVEIEYIGVDNVPSVQSPWVGAQSAIINGKKYTIRSFNLTSTPLAPSYFAAGAIPNGSALSIISVNNVAFTSGDVLILLGKSPYASVDRIYDQYIDASMINSTSPEVFYTSGKGYTQRSIVKQTYPYITVV